MNYYVLLLKLLIKIQFFKQTVKILISSKLQTEIIATDSDEDGNFSVQKVKINDHILVIGSVYGPNINENIGIFYHLTAAVKNLNTTDIILGGDWNCTWDCRNVDVNVDVLDMVSIPSKRRSEKLKQMCNGLGLTDPFRVLYPNKKTTRMFRQYFSTQTDQD